MKNLDEMTEEERMQLYFHGNHTFSEGSYYVWDFWKIIKN